MFDMNLVYIDEPQSKSSETDVTSNIFYNISFSHCSVASRTQGVIVLGFFLKCSYLRSSSLQYFPVEVRKGLILVV